MAKKVTLADIAEKLNCSVSVVSRALNDKYGVSDDMRTKIRVTALEMGFDFKSIVPSGAKAKNGICHINVAMTKADLLDEGFYLQIIYSVEKALNSRKIDFSLSLLESGKDVDLWMDLKEHKADGVIVLGMVSDKDRLAAMTSGIPAVLVDTADPGAHVDWLTVNNYKGAHNAARYLAGRGHTRVTFVGLPGYSFNFDERYRGYLDACRALPGADAESLAIARVEDMRGLLSRPGRPTAVLTANDRLALKVYDIARELGLSIPGDLSVMGFDDIEKGRWVEPQLTTIHVPKRELGEEAVRMLAERIRNPDAVARWIQLDTHLVERESVSSPAPLDSYHPVNTI